VSQGSCDIQPESDRMRDMESFLAREQAAGEMDSAGAFTLNATRARQLMEKYQLPERRAYILKLIQWAVSSGATSVEIEATRSRVVVRHDGQPVPLSRVDELRTGSNVLDHLARGVYGAFGLDPKNVFLSTQGSRYELSSGKAEAVDPAWQSVHVTGLKAGFFERSPMVQQTLRSQWLHVDAEGPLQRLIWDSTGLGGLESSLVRWFCAYAPIPIRVNGRLVNRPVFVPMTSKRGSDGHLRQTPAAQRSGTFHFLLTNREKHLLAPPHAYPGMTFKWHDRTEIPHPDERPDAGPALRFQSMAYKRADIIDYIYTTRSNPTSQILFIQDGVVVDQRRIRTKPSHYTLVEASGLAVSATGFQLVQNNDYHRLIDRVSEFTGLEREDF
jgi:hypothetical protein